MAIRTVSLLTASLVLALASVAARAETTVTLVAYNALFQDRYTKAVIEPFEKLHPDIKINYYGQASSAAMLGQLRAAKAAPQADVVIMDVSVSKAGTDEGLFEKLDASAMPVINDLYPAARVPDIAGVAVTFDNLVMLYNTAALPEAPKSLMDMADPKFKGKVVIPGIPDIQGLSLVIILDKQNGGQGVAGKFDKGIEAMEKIAPNVLTWEPKPEVYAPVIAGDAVIGVGWNARAQVNSDTSGGKLKAVIPSEGTAFQINTINLVKGGPATDAAKVFIAYALSAEAQKSFTETMFYAPTNAKAQIADSAINRTAVKFMDKVVPIDWLAIAKVRDQVADQWRRKVIPLSR
jgi:putative spermidine/putrescine transport system substrate-binding protein